MDIWRVPEQWLEQAHDDATIVAIRDMERAGIDIITDGEIRRESYSNRFATALEGIDTAKPRSGQGAIGARNRGAARGRQDKAHACGGGARHGIPAQNTDRMAKITLPGPFTMSQQATTSSIRTRRRW